MDDTRMIQGQYKDENNVCLIHEPVRYRNSAPTKGPYSFRVGPVAETRKLQVAGCEVRKELRVERVREGQRGSKRVKEGQGGSRGVKEGQGGSRRVKRGSKSDANVEMIPVLL
jgi:hypothetical protein